MSTRRECKRFELKRVVIEESAPHKPGVYAFWHKEKARCVYVGRSDNVHDRLLDHYKRVSHSKALHEWIDAWGTEMQFCFIKVADEKEAKEVEGYFIKKLNPHANIQKPRRI